MLKIIIDTNVVISFLITNSDFIKKIIELKNRRKADLHSSTEIFEEIKNTLQKPKIKELLKVNPRKVASFMALYKYNLIFEEPYHSIDVCRDSKDDKFLELSKTIQADFLITGDKDLLELKQFENTQILKPSEFIAKLDTIL